MVDITVVFSDPNQINSLNLKEGIEWHLLDEFSVKTQRDARRVKGSFAARKTPFAVIKIDNEVYKALYSEADNVIEELNKFTNDCNENVSTG